jgi:hypothetical protein
MAVDKMVGNNIFDDQMIVNEKTTEKSRNKPR